MSISTKSDPDREYITTAEAEKRSRLSRNYLALLLRKGELEGFRPSRDWFIYTDSLELFLAKERKPGPHGPRGKKQPLKGSNSSAKNGAS